MGAAKVRAAKAQVTGRKPLDGGMEIVSGQADLPQAVRTLRAAAASRALHRRQQQRDQNADNADHNQQFDEGKAPAKRRAIGEEIRIMHEKPRRIVPLRLIVATSSEKVNSQQEVIGIPCFHVYNSRMNGPQNLFPRKEPGISEKPAPARVTPEIHERAPRWLSGDGSQRPVPLPNQDRRGSSPVESLPLGSRRDRLPDKIAPIRDDGVSRHQQRPGFEVRRFRGVRISVEARLFRRSRTSLDVPASRAKLERYLHGGSGNL